MSIKIEQLVNEIEELKLFGLEGSASTLRDILESPDIQSAGQFLTKLVEVQMLTSFQAERISDGNATSLVLGNCVLLNQLGKGGMGTVYKARHRKMDRLVALKIISPSTVETPSLLARFQQEVKVAAKLEHPNIVTAYDAGEDKGVHYLVMQYVPGNDLSVQLKRQGPFSVPQALNVLSQAATGLQYAHSQGVVHRDIKPANILLDQKGHVKILDMGLARVNALVEGEDKTFLTQSGLILGTASYMAPEQSLNSRAADARSDIYSLGCVLFHMLTGRPIYQCETFLQTVIAHREQPVPKLFSPHQEISQPLDKFFQKLVAKKPEDRFKNMEAVRNALEPLIQANTATCGNESPITDSGLRNFVEGLEIANTPTQIHSNDTAKYVENREQGQNTLDGIEIKVSSQPYSSSRPSPRQAIRGRNDLKAIIFVSLVVTFLLFIGWNNVSGRRSDRLLGTLLINVIGENFLTSVKGKSLTLQEVTTGKLETIELTQPEILVKNLIPGIYEIRYPPESGIQTNKTQFEISHHNSQSIKVWWEPAAKESVSDFWEKLPADAPLPARIPFSRSDALSMQNAWADYLNIPVEFEIETGITLRLIPPGDFEQGITEGEANYLHNEAKELGIEEFLISGLPDQVGCHQVYLTRPYYISTTEVTQKQFEQVTDYNPAVYSPTGALKDRVDVASTEQFPVDCTWLQAVDFCNKLSEKENLEVAYIDGILMKEKIGYRLPSEAEWEFACRGGTTTRWWWGERASELVEQEWVLQNSGNRPRKVATSKPNPFGIYDMHGNYWEWSHDWYEPYKTQFWQEININPFGPELGEMRVGRGGHYSNSVQVGSSDYRGRSDTERNDAEIGFRVVLPVEFLLE